MRRKDIILLSLSNLKANKLRTALTVVIIALGITALVGILTSIDGIIYSMNDKFNSLGANSFSIDRKYEIFKSRRRGSRFIESPPINFDEAHKFKEKFSHNHIVGLSFSAKSNATVRYANKKTNPTIYIEGIDENYFMMTGLEIQTGRGFSTQELRFGSNKVILGSNLIDLLFDGNADWSIGKNIKIEDLSYEVVGVIKSRGATMNEGADKQIFMPLEKARIDFAQTNPDYDIVVQVKNPEEVDHAVSEAIGEMRVIRGLKSYQDNDFEIGKSDGLISFLKENTVKIRAATILIGLLTLLGAAIGLMNIMLVSVTERTKEIGIVKSLGATEKNIKDQFLYEAIAICQLGGIIGILLGIPVGNIVTILMDGQFLIPWSWILLGFVVCTLVGVLSGIYPANKAAKLDPVESLRFE